jgi:hypothetical protein
MDKPITLSAAQKAAVRRYVERFRRYMDTPEFQQDQEQRLKRVTFFQQKLPGLLEDLSETDVEALLSQLWATAAWGNKTYLAQKIVNDNGLQALRHQFKQLLTSDDPEEAYGQFLERIKGLGPASTTEILAYVHPDRCGIWNRRARDALRILGITDSVNTGKYHLSVQEYRTFNRLLQAIAEELRSAGIPDVDLLMVDFFLYEITRLGPEVGTGLVEKPTTPKIASFDHDEVRDLIAQIGTSLGFDTDLEVKIAHGAKVDVVWRARIANLGIVKYVFEVHRSGSIDSLLLNLQKARSAHSVQKVIAVSDEEQLEQIRRECEGLPEEFRRALRFWPVSDVVQTADLLQRVMESIGRLGLIEDTAA